MKKRKSGRPFNSTKYPFKSIAIGKSKVIETDNPVSCASAARSYARRYGLRFSCEMVNNRTAVRVKNIRPDVK